MQHVATPQAPAAPTQSTAAERTRFRDLPRRAKMAFVGKLMIFLISCGFAFPQLLSD